MLRIMFNKTTKNYDVMSDRTERPVEVDFPSLADVAEWAEEEGYQLALVAGVGFAVKRAG